MLCDDFEIDFVCKEIPDSSVREIIDLGLGFIQIETEDEFLARLTPDVIVVVDHYGLDSAYQKTIKEIGCKLVCIDDLHDKVFYADLIINHAPNISSSDYQAQTYTKFALGLEYVLLRPAFLKKAAQNKKSRKIKTVFVCFGGSDNRNITKTVTDILKNDTRFQKIIVVTGAAYPYLEKLMRSTHSDSRFFLHHSVGGETMIDLIEESELAIVPASGILQEVLAVGCNIVSGIYVENQKYLYENYKILEAFQSAGNFSDADIRRAIDTSFKNQSAVRNNFIDGQSGDRLLKQFLIFGG
jgi:UDP-2,4-diacetamido-2,4,6-trideoxy-beta-L-altropyranose hydrolase